MTCNQLPGDLASMGQATFNETTFEGIGFGFGFSVVAEPSETKVLCSAGEYAFVSNVRKSSLRSWEPIAYRRPNGAG